MNPIANLAFTINLDPNVNPFTSFWTSGQAADWFWAAFALIAVAIVIVAARSGRRHRRR